MVSRRDLLQTFGVSATLGFAGCGGLFSTESSRQTSTPDAATPARTPTVTLRPEGTATPSDPAGTTILDQTLTPTPSPTATDTPPSTGSATATAARTSEIAGTPAFTPSDGPDPHDFGTSVALVDGVALVDREGDSVAVFESSDDGWRQTATLTPEREDITYSNLPVPIVLDSETAYIGGIRLGDNGAVDVIERVGDEWTRQTQVTPDDPPEDFYNFGRSVAYSDGTLVVGAVNEPTPMVSYRGHVFVFEGSGDDWTQVADFGTDPHDLFGRSVAVSGDRLLVGAPATGEGTNWDGTVYGYERSDGEWIQASTLSVEAEDTAFGRQVALDGDTAVVAAIESDSPGRVYVFERTEDGWTQQDSFPGAQGADGADAACTITLQGSTALLGNPRDDTAGEAVRLERVDDGWERTERFVANSRDPADRFGAAVALDGQAALVGAPTFDDERPGRGYLFDL